MFYVKGGAKYIYVKYTTLTAFNPHRINSQGNSNHQHMRFQLESSSVKKNHPV